MSSTNKISTKRTARSMSQAAAKVRVLVGNPSGIPIGESLPPKRPENEHKVEIDLLSDSDFDSDEDDKAALTVRGTGDSSTVNGYNRIQAAVPSSGNSNCLVPSNATRRNGNRNADSRRNTETAPSHRHTRSQTASSSASKGNKLNKCKILYLMLSTLDKSAYDGLMASDASDIIIPSEYNGRDGIPFLAVRQSTHSLGYNDFQSLSQMLLYVSPSARVGRPPLILSSGKFGGAKSDFECPSTLYLLDAIEEALGQNKIHEVCILLLEARERILSGPLLENRDGKENLPWWVLRHLANDADDDDDDIEEVRAPEKEIEIISLLGIPSSANSDCRMSQLLKQTHVVGVPESYISSIRKTEAFDFSHACPAIQELLLRNPGKSVYCFFKKENNDLPSLCCILTPSGQSPPSLCMNKEINATSGIVPFDTLRLRWAPISKASEYDRMFQLIHDTDITTTNTNSDTGDDFYSLERYGLFLPDIGSLVGMSKKISKVSFLVTRSDGTKVSVEYDKESCGSIDEFVSKATKAHNLGDTVVARNGLGRNLKAAMNSKRTRLLSRADFLAKKSGFDSVQSYLDFYGNLIKAKIFPIQYTSRPNSEINDSYGDADSSLVVTDFCSLNPFSMHLGGIATLDSVKLDATGGNSAHTLLLMLLLVELLSRLRRLDMLSRDENNLEKLVPLERLAYFAESQGCQFNEGGEGTFRDLRCALYSALLSMTKRAGRCPRDLKDFICNFGLFDYNASTSIDLSQPAKFLRLTSDNHNGLQLVLEDGSCQNIHPCVLPALTSASYLPTLIKKLLLSPSRQVHLPAECVKQALMSLPDAVLSPSGKKRVEKSFPDHEIMYHELNGFINSNVRSINIKNTPKHSDPHHHAMTAKAIMVATATIEGSSRSHAVVIDGTKGQRGTIYDPSEGFGEVQRSTAGLKKLGIKSFTQAYEIQRNDISYKRRAKLQRDTGLPFFS